MTVTLTVMLTAMLIAVHVHAAVSIESQRSFVSHGGEGVFGEQGSAMTFLKWFFFYICFADKRNGALEMPLLYIFLQRDPRNNVWNIYVNRI